MQINIAQRWLLSKPYPDLLLSVICTVAPCLFAADTDNIHMRGWLIEHPCLIAPEDREIHVDMLNVLNHSLYYQARGPSQEFQIRLIECKTELAGTVRIQFYAPESKELPGLMRVNAGKQSSGLAIGLEKSDGSRLNFNEDATVHSITDGNNTIHLSAYLQAEPSAIANKSIQIGPFQAISTFFIEYD